MHEEDFDLVVIATGSCQERACWRRPVSRLLMSRFSIFVGCGASGRLQQARLDPQHLGDGPAFTGLVRNGESFFDNIQCSIAAAPLSVGLGFELRERSAARSNGAPPSRRRRPRRRLNAE